MRSIFTLITFLIILLSAVAFSQDFERTGGLARLSGMGGNPYVIDPFFVTVNPAWGRNYDNFLMGDLGSSAGAPFSAGGGGQFVSAIFSLGPQWTLGGLLTRNDFNGISIALLDPGSVYGMFPGVVNTVNNIISETGAVTSLDNNVEVMSTFTTGKTSVGLGVAYASTSREENQDSITAEGSATQFGFNLGILSEITSHFKLDVGASLVLPSANFTVTSLDEVSANQTIIMVNARAFWEMKSDLYLVPIAIFLTESGTVDSGFASAVTGEDDMVSFTMIGAGLGLNYTIGDFLLAGGLSFATTNQTIPGDPELENSSFIFPAWNIGGEWNMTDWVMARLGYIAATNKVTIQSSSTTESVFTFFLPPQRGFTVGLGFRLGDFSLDATINEDVLRQGLNNIGGGGATFAYLSASYAIP